MKGTMKKGFAAFLAVAVLISGIPFDMLADTVESTETVVEEPEEATESEEVTETEKTEEATESEEVTETEELEEVTETEEVAETEKLEEATESEKAETEEPTEASTEEIIETEEPEELQETEEVQAEIKKSESVKATKDFYYTRELSGGLKVTLSADKGVVPDDAEVTMELIENDKLDTLKDAIKEKMQSEENPIFNWYSDVTVSVEDTYALDIKITYVDNDGMVCVYEPQENQSIRVNVEQSGLKEASEDEMREVNLFYTSDIPQSDIRYAGVQTTGKTADIELLDNNLTVEGEGICFDANHFSVYVVSVIKYQGNASAEKIAAEQKAWNLINKYADPDYFLTDPKRATMTDSQYEELRQAALQVVAGCTTQYEKIKAITAFVADRTYYDFKYISDKDNEVRIVDPYKVYTQKRTVCAGYARLMRTLFISIGIPCMDLHGTNHEYNAVYDSGSGKWIFADATWCSNNRYTTDGTWEYNGYSYWCFELTPEEIAELSSHEVFGIDGLLYNDVYYSMVAPKDAEQWDNGGWYLSLLGIKNKSIEKIKCNGLENLNVLGTVGYKVFEECNSLKEVDLSQTGITELGKNVFNGCATLKTVRLPKTLTKIGNAEFSGCSSLEEIDLSQTGITELGKNAFNGCTALKTAKLPKTLTTIGQNMFYGCTALEEVDLSQTGITELGKNAFNGCASLKTLKLPKTLTQIGDSEFSGCSSLEEIDLSQTGITELGTDVFYNCRALKIAKLPKTLKKIGDDTFSGCTLLEEMDLSQTEVTELGVDVFYNCKALKSVKLPKNLAKVGQRVFSGCSSLEGIDLSQTGITELGKNVFYGCASLKTVKLPKTLTKIGSSEFSGCSSLEEIDLSQTGITELGNVFSNCRSTIKTVKLPSTLTTIGEDTFYGCTALEEVDLSRTGVKEIQKYAFYNCGILKKVKFPKTLTTIGEYAFYGCILLEEVDFSKTKVKTIGEAAFFNCKKLNVVRLPKTATQIGNFAFDVNNPNRSDALYVVTNIAKNKINERAFGNTGNVLIGPYLYKIKFDGNGATKGEMGTRLCAANEEECLDNSYQRKGYTFAGWNTQADGKGTLYEENACVKNLTKNADEVVTLYAQWKTTQYQITYKLDGGKNNKKNPNAYSINSKTIKFANPSKKGYVFKGWYRDKNYKKKVTSIEKGSTGKVTLYAKWAKEKYTITYKLNGGKNHKKNPKTYTVTSKTIKLANPSRKGYVFKGWYRDKKCTKKVTSIKKGSTGKVTLYAKWKKK